MDTELESNKNAKESQVAVATRNLGSRTMASEVDGVNDLGCFLVCLLWVQFERTNEDVR